MTEKTCSKCGDKLLAVLANFSACPECRDGLVSVCRRCSNARQNAWRLKNRDRLLARRRQEYAETNGKRWKELERRRQELHPYRVQAERLMGGVRIRSKKLGLERSEELSKKQFFIDWLKKQPNCQCCGAEFFIGPKNGTFVDASPSIDRFNPNLGYTLDNIALVCWRCNNIKRNYSSGDLRLVADWMDAWGNEKGKFDE